MDKLIAILLTIAGLFSVATATTPPTVVYKDVAIIGGGAAGSYAAVRLRDDYGKSVAVVEKEANLGGHVNSWTDPESGVTLDHGVKTFIDSGNATGFFDRFGIDAGSSPQLDLTTKYIDFETGESVDFQPPEFTDILEGLEKFRVVAEMYEPLIQGPGYFNFPEPEDIPEDLLLPFGDVITKYGFESAMPLIYESTGLGIGNITNELTIWALQAFGASMARAILGIQGTFVPATLRNQDLYDAVAETLGRDVYYSSTVINTWRSDFGVALTVKNHKTGKITEIHARQLLISIEPTKENVGVFRLDRDETKVLSKFTYSRLYSGIINNDNLVVNTSYFNLPPSAAPKNYLAFPEMSFNARIDWLGEGQFFRVTIIGDDNLSAEGAKALVQEDFSKLIRAGVLQGSSQERVSWVDFQVHGPMHARVSEEDLKDGFFQELYALQGRKSTWWTGGAWAVNFQTHLWEFDDIIIPQMLEGLD